MKKKKNKEKSENKTRKVGKRMRIAIATDE